ncbi:MAG: HIRAN domain-containing protein [Flavobacteriales bacterium]
MRQLQFQAVNENRVLPLKLVTLVEALASYDMIYIYHHLYKGAKLQLKRDEDYPLNNQAVAVYFKGFKLGYLPEAAAKAVVKQMLSSNTAKAIVSGMCKNKYMPLSGLDVELIFEN